MNDRKRKRTRLGQGKRERYLQPSLLMGLLLKQSYGYELIQSIQEFGFVEGQAPPGMVYRHLRQLEGDGLVISEWETEGSGPAKRIYRLTGDGLEVLELWVEHMERQTQKLGKFIERYRSLSQ
ncbi:MAG: helix-turn-helix transcriptional regulator [Deltaproteobacteria bacterium]|jgi:PadR family transcriptional regulator PadR